MRKRITFLVILFIVISATVMAFADSPSATKCIRLYVRVVSKEGIESRGGVVESASFDEDEMLDVSIPKPARGVTQVHKVNPFSKISDVFMNLFSPFANTSKDMIRKY